ncbi:MAG TPA: ATP-binding protein, partial [Polyangiaceae bacterium]|nr:ATP-binding protein [Polyangiaceae bacterium]
PLSYVLSNLESLTEELPEVLDTIATFFALAEGVEHPATLEALVRDAGQRMSSVVLSEILDRFKDALTGAQRMRDITRGLSSFARVDEDQLVPVSVAHVIDLALNMAHNEFKYRARVVKEYGRIPTVLAHEGRLCQVFVNLLTNAAHSIDEGNVEKNEIRVTTWTEANQICITVGDTGSGISDDNLSRLFEPFFTTKKIGQGSGLGLPISKNIVESYGGTLQVTSEVGKGTQVTVRLPRRAGNQVLDSSTEAPPSRPPIRGRVLIVDDEEGMRAAITRVLRGHEVVWAASGAEAMTILERDSAFDLVLCDVMMSDVTGMDLHLWLLANHPRLGEQLIFMTGGAFTPRARAHLGKVDNIRLEKPIDSANLRRLVSDRVQQNHRS